MTFGNKKLLKNSSSNHRSMTSTLSAFEHRSSAILKVGETFFQESATLTKPKMLFFLLLDVLLASSTAGKSFECMNVADLDMDTVNVQEFSYISKKSCAHKCVSMDDACSAFHHSEGKCYLLPPTSSWNEQQMNTSAEVCMKANGENPKCNSQQFPEVHGRSRYVLVREKMNWRDAATKCESMNAKLAQVSTQEEMQAIETMLRKHHAESRTFNGLLQLPGANGKNDGWVWHRSGDPMTPEMWQHGEPNDYHGKDQDVGAFFPNGRSDDSDSSNRLYFMCECFVV